MDWFPLYLHRLLYSSLISSVLHALFLLKLPPFSFFFNFILSNRLFLTLCIILINLDMITVWPLDATFMQEIKVTRNRCLTLRKCLVARKRVESVSCAFAHCSANGVTASRQSWQTSELILIMGVKELKSDFN